MPKLPPALFTFQSVEWPRMFLRVNYPMSKQAAENTVKDIIKRANPRNIIEEVESCYLDDTLYIHITFRMSTTTSDIMRGAAWQSIEMLVGETRSLMQDMLEDAMSRHPAGSRH